MLVGGTPQNPTSLHDHAAKFKVARVFLPLRLDHEGGSKVCNTEFESVTGSNALLLW